MVKGILRRRRIAGLVDSVASVVCPFAFQFAPYFTCTETIFQSATVRGSAPRSFLPFQTISSTFSVTCSITFLIPFLIPALTHLHRFLLCSRLNSPCSLWCSLWWKHRSDTKPPRTTVQPWPDDPGPRTTDPPRQSITSLSHNYDPIQL